MMAASGGTGNATVMASKSLRRTLVVAGACLPMAGALALLVSPAFLALALAPLVPYEAPLVQLKERSDRRKESVERELPFFSILANVLGGAGVPLHSTLEGVAGSGVFSSVGREAMIVERDIEVFGMNPADSLDRVASHHPSAKFSRFLRGYTSKVRSGGDLPAYFLGESGGLLRELEESWARYAARVGVIGSLMITVFGVVPLLLLVVGFFSPGTAVSGLTAFALVGVPSMSAALVYMAGSMQPVEEAFPKGNAKGAFAAGVLGLAAGMLLAGPWLGVSLGSAGFMVAYGLTVRGKLRAMRETDEALPRFLTDMLDFKRQEHDLGRSLVSVAAHNTYSPTFDRLLAGVVSQLSSGTPLDETKVDAKTSLSKVAFFVLGQMARSGGGTADSLFQLSQYTSRATEMKKNAQAEVKPYLLLSYATPLLLAFGVTFVGSVLASFGSTFHRDLSVGNLSLPAGQVTPALSQAADLLIATTAAGLGIVGSKISDFTARNTLRASTNVVIATAAVAVVPLLGLTSLFHFPL